MVKATDEKVPLTGGKVVTPKVTSLLKKEELAPKFGKLDIKINEYEEISTKIVVNSPDTLSVAENHAKGVQGMLNDIELVRKTLKGPYYETGKAIDAYSKLLVDPLNRAKTRIGSQITSFKDLQAAQERLRIEKEQNEREKHEKVKLVEIEKLSRIKKQLFARIYGGIYYTKGDVQKTSAGCVTPADCDNMELFIKEKFPSAAGFEYLKEELEDTKNNGYTLLTEYKSHLIDLDSNNVDIRENARKLIAQAKVDAEVEAIDDVATLKKDVEKTSEALGRQDKKDLKSASKGVRETVKFKIENPAAVPVDFKVISESLIHDFVKTNGPRIKNALKDQKQLIPGISFYVDTKFVTSG